jgi:hypothetical protein
MVPWKFDGILIANAAPFFNLPLQVSTPSAVVQATAAVAAGAIATALVTSNADVNSAADSLRILVSFIIT